MNTADVLKAIGDWLALAAAIGLMLAWIAYAIFFRWSLTRAGRAMFMFMTACVSVFVLNTTSLIFGTVWGPEAWNIRLYVRIAVYLFGIYAVGWLAYALIFNYRRRGPVVTLEPRVTRGEPAAKERQEQ